MDDLTGVARDAQTLLDVLADYSQRGWPDQFAVTDEGTVECETCHARVPAGDAEVLALRRLEGASDPDDMLAVVALGCPRCGHRGSLVLHFGAIATAEEIAVLEALPDAPPPDGPR